MSATERIETPVSATGETGGAASSAPASATVAQPERRVNDFQIHAATVNGSGSQSANNVLMRSIFGMGVPVSGKNLFPSNIQGLPTWFTIRVNENGWVARKSDVEILIAMNEQTAADDVRKLPVGAVCISPKEMALDKVRSDVIHYQVPFKELAAETTSTVKLRKLLENMIYVGVAAELLAIDFAQVEASIKRQFAGKTKAIDLNILAVRKGRDWAKNNLKKTDPFYVERRDKTAGKIIIDGNSAAALGCMFAGVTVLAWYPITPSSSLGETLTEYLHQYRVSKSSGKPTFAVVQAEDELAALGMALGAGWAGARAMTCTSGPGISLMAEFAGFGYFAEIPAVIVDVMRVGPSTGLPTRTSQADLLSVYQLSHGDTKHIVLLPGSVDECFQFAGQAFDLAERFQTPVFVLSDLDLGMNNWMSDPFQYPQKPLDRGEVMTAEQVTEAGSFARYLDTDGDGIAARTLPGTNNPQAAYFTRGSGHNEKAGYSEKPKDYKNLMDRLGRKYATAKQFVPKPSVELTKSKVGIIAFGSSDFAVGESRQKLRTESGLETSYLRLRALPLTDEVKEFISAHDRVYVVEQNRDAQLRGILSMELPELAGKLRSVLYYDGLPLDAASVTNSILAQERS